VGCENSSGGKGATLLALRGFGSKPTSSSIDFRRVDKAVRVMGTVYQRVLLLSRSSRFVSHEFGNSWWKRGGRNGRVVVI
jgi:hypothetical protein